MYLPCTIVFSSLWGLASAVNDVTNPGSGLTAHVGDLVQLLWTNLADSNVNITLEDSNSAFAYQITPANSDITNKGNFPWLVKDVSPGLNFAIKISSYNGNRAEILGTSFSPLFAIVDASQSGTSSASPSASLTAQSSNTLSASSVAPATSAPAGVGATVGSGQAGGSTSNNAGSGTTAGLIAGIVVGVVGAIALGALAMWLILRRRRTNGGGSGGYDGRTGPQNCPRNQHQQPPPQMGYAAPLNPENLDQHLASQEWSGVRRDVPQKQTAYQNVVQQDRYGGSTYGGGQAGGEGGGDGMSRMSELRPQDAPGESRYGDVQSVIHSEAPMTAMHPASESVWHPRV